jgi:Ran GTPase-activating protein (RanGAP) involved in mRNA processing and transport
MILASPIADGVTHLVLGGLARTAEDGEALANSLAESTHLTRLESLYLGETAFTDSAATLLSRAGWTSLNRLVILPYDDIRSDEPITLPTMTASGVESLMSARWASTVNELELSGHPIGDTGAEAIARNRRLEQLRRLTLMRVGLTTVGLRALVDAYSHRLTHLQLAGNTFGDEGAQVIADTSWPEMVPYPRGAEYEQRGLFLARCGITDVGAEALLSSIGIPQNIPDLFLGQSTVSDDLVALLKAKYPSAQVRF